MHIDNWKLYNLAFYNKNNIIINKIKAQKIYLSNLKVKVEECNEFYNYINHRNKLYLYKDYDKAVFNYAYLCLFKLSLI